MKSRTLLGAVLRLHVIVVACTCLFLVAGTMGVAAFLLQSDQQNSLRSIADAACRGIVSEQKVIGSGYLEAARVFLQESAIDGVRRELFESSGALLTAEGDLNAWSETGEILGLPGDCATRSVATGGGRQTDYLYCAERCDDRHSVQVIARNVLDQHDVRRAAVALLLLLPAAVLVGAVAGRIGIAKLLRPLVALRGAVNRLDPNPGQSLRVGAKMEELATLERAFDDLLRRLGDAIEREKRFTQEASHELRTPLTVLRGRLERLAQNAGAGADPGAELSLALRDLDSIDRLIDALLVLARSDSEGFPVQPVNLCDVAREIAEIQSATDGATSPQPEVLAPDEILVRGNEDLLSRALANVVENARKYGGRDARIRIRVSKEGTRGVIKVEDTGKGIEPALRPLVFDRFSRGPGRRSQIKGSGLGLAVVKVIVERHGGTVDTGPSELGGEAVWFALPLLDSARRGTLPGGGG